MQPPNLKKIQEKYIHNAQSHDNTHRFNPKVGNWISVTKSIHQTWSEPVTAYQHGTGIHFRTQSHELPDIIQTGRHIVRWIIEIILLFHLLSHHQADFQGSFRVLIHHARPEMAICNYRYPLFSPQRWFVTKLVSFLHRQYAAEL